MLRYYISYVFQGGYGAIDFETKVPITDRARLTAIQDEINRRNGRVMPGLMIVGFSRYAPRNTNKQHSDAASQASR